MNETALLQIFAAKGMGRKRINTLLARLKNQKLSAADFIELPYEEMELHFRIPPKIGQEIHNARATAEAMTEMLTQHDIEILSNGDGRYPQHLVERLGEEAPPMLFVKGNLELLHQPSVGFSGSREATEAGLLAAQSISTQLAQTGVNVVSGYARGIDLCAHQAALQTGGCTTFVMVEGILNFKPKKQIQYDLDGNNFLVLSEHWPDTKWFTNNAMSRNLTICALSNALIIVEATVDGGSFAAGSMAQKLGCPLVVVDYGDDHPQHQGNNSFFEQGATPLPYNKGTLDIQVLQEILNSNQSYKKLDLNLSLLD